MLTVLDLFSGIGGVSLGLDRTGGFRTVAFCEQNIYATAVLNRHWPGVPVFSDVCGVSADTLACAGIPAPDVVCGGFPCQDISLAGAGAGLGGTRSRLWFEMLRIITETHPSWVIAENVAALRSRGLDVVLRGFSEIGYDAEWHCIPASALGAPHRRDRVWIVAYPNGQHGRESDSALGVRASVVSPRSSGTASAGGSGISATDVAESMREQHQGGCTTDKWPQTQILSRLQQPDAWAAEPDVGRVANGVPRRVDRLRCLGNAVIPQIPEMIGRAILSHIHSVSIMETTE